VSAGGEKAERVDVRGSCVVGAASGAGTGVSEVNDVMDQRTITFSRSDLERMSSPWKQTL
jgi:hypothetical protein